MIGIVYDGGSVIITHDFGEEVKSYVGRADGNLAQIVKSAEGAIGLAGGALAEYINRAKKGPVVVTDVLGVESVVPVNNESMLEMAGIEEGDLIRLGLSNVPRPYAEEPMGY